MNQKAMPTGRQGFSQIILLGIVAVFVLAGAGGLLVFREKKTLSPELAAVPGIVGVPKFIQADFIDLEHVAAISKFRSGSGHDFSRGSGETCRSMKHYFNVPRTEQAEQFINRNKGFPPPPDGTTDIPIYSPVDGKIISIESEQMPIGKQIYIQPDAAIQFTIRLFHIYPLSNVKKGTHVKAGQKIGVIGQYQNTDIAITKGWSNYVSYFEVMPDNIFANYQALGIKNRNELIISKAERDASPLQCNGERFAVNYDSDSHFGNFIYLHHQVEQQPIQKTPITKNTTSPIGATTPPPPTSQPNKEPLVPSIAIETSDGFKLSYSYNKVSSRKVVLLLHMYGGNKEDWNSLSKKLNENGFSTLAIDFRGHGGSDGTKSMSPEFLISLITDIEAAKNMLVRQGYTEIDIVAASVGANDTMLFVTKDNSIKKLALLSPSNNELNGMKISDFINFYNGNILFVTATQDSKSYQGTKELNQAYHGPKDYIEYDTNLHGTPLLGAYADLSDKIILFLNK